MARIKVWITFHAQGSVRPSFLAVSGTERVNQNWFLYRYWFRSDKPFSSAWVITDVEGSIGRIPVPSLVPSHPSFHILYYL